MKNKKYVLEIMEFDEKIESISSALHRITIAIEQGDEKGFNPMWKLSITEY